MDQHHLGAILLYQLSTLLTDGIRHDDLHRISLYRTYQCNTDPLISAGRLYDDGILPDQPCLLRLTEHIVCCSGLYGTADIDPLIFDQNLCGVLIHHPVQADHRRMADCLQYIIINHFIFLQNRT